MATNSFSIQIKGLDELSQKFGSSEKALDGYLQQAMDRSTREVKKNVRQEITDKKISNQGELRKSVNVYESTPFRGVVAVGEKYGLYVEKGTRPHRPPVGPLERWAKTKLQQSGLGFVIARKIAREGTKANPFVKPAYKKSIRFVQDQFKEAIGELTRFLSRGRR
jgi:HK97 gp10 family phage protein